LKEVPLTEAYKEYTDPKDAKNDEDKANHAVQFIEDRFTGHDKSKEKRIYTFETTATDTNLVKNIFVTVKDIIIKLNFKDSGLE